MVNIKEENKNKQSESTREENKELCKQQRQQLENTTTTANKINNNINEYQTANKTILEKSIDTTNRYQQETINTIQSISNNYLELQKNILNIYKSTFSQFLI